MSGEGSEERNEEHEGEGRGIGVAVTASIPRRPMRADARRNVERLIAVAREAIAERGADASLDDIARRAGVGPGTLYRHFPTRGALIEAVYRDGVATLCDTGDRLGETEPPEDALIDWLRAFVAFVAQKRALAGALMDSMDNRDRVFRECHGMIEATGSSLLARAKATGAIREDIDLNDLVRLASALARAGEGTPDGAAVSDRLLRLALEGLRPREK